MNFGSLKIKPTSRIYPLDPCLPKPLLQTPVLPTDVDVKMCVGGVIATT